MDTLVAIINIPNEKVYGLTFAPSFYYAMFLWGVSTYIQLDFSRSESQMGHRTVFVV